ncbi:MAG TPA: FAD binding domain-containing protein [Candidatus Limnocylindrales bacterium]|nr:FAD binding domain-containing protein [Candidatus Limnocylindrales bacterium]
MLRLPRLRYVRAASVRDAVETVATQPGAMLIGGGTDLLPNLKRRQFDAPVLVSLRGVAGLERIERDDPGGVTIGAGATLDAVAAHPLLQDGWRALARACGDVSTPQIRYMGTIGGNLMVDPRCNYYNQSEQWRKAVGYCMKRDGDLCLVARSSPRCWAISSSDSAPVAVALDAQVTLEGMSGSRRVPVSALYQDDGIAYTSKHPEEVITALHLDRVPSRLTSAYWKLRRRGSFDFPILGVAIACWWDDGVVTRARGALGAVASHPVDISDYLAALSGARPTDDLLAQVAEAADKPSRPLDNADLSHYWRKRMTRVYIERALREACGLAPLQGRLSAQVRA